MQFIDSNWICQDCKGMLLLRQIRKIQFCFQFIYRCTKSTSMKMLVQGILGFCRFLSSRKIVVNPLILLDIIYRLDYLFINCFCCDGNFNLILTFQPMTAQIYKSTAVIGWKFVRWKIKISVLWKGTKGQLNSEWIYEVIVSPKIPTKNYIDFCPGSSLLQG